MQELLKKLLGVALAFAVGIGVFLGMSGSNLDKYDNLLQPGISVLPDRTMLIIELKKNTEKSMRNVWVRLQRAYTMIEHQYRLLGDVAPKLRIRERKSTLVYSFGLPIAEPLNPFPEKLKDPSLNISMEDWHYGEVAEILHKGSYDTEFESHEKLLAYIKESNYSICGPLEREFLQGPKLVFKSNPSKYLTILRYPVTSENITEAYEPSRFPLISQD